MEERPQVLDYGKAPSGARDYQRWIVAAVAVAGLVLVAWLASAWGGGFVPPPEEHIGFWSLLPALSTLVLVFLTRNVIVSLFLGIVVGGMVSGQVNVLSGFLLPAIGTESYALILVVYLWAMGGLIGLWTRTGGAQAFAEWAGRGIVRGPRTAQLFAWLMGVVFHQGGTISTLLAGTTVRPINDAHRVSHEELTYVVDSTASPVATILPFNAWPLYVAGLVAGVDLAYQRELFPDIGAGVSFFFASIHLNFYAIFAVLMTLLFSLGWLPWVGRKMSRAIERARTTGELNAPGSHPLTSPELSEVRLAPGYRGGVADFMAPMGVLLGVAVMSFFLREVMFVWSYVPVLGPAVAEAVTIPEQRSVWIGEAFGLAVLAAFVLAVLKGMSITEAMGGVISGCQGVTVGAIILGLAVTLGLVSRQLGTAAYIVETTAGLVQPIFLPAIFMGICMAVAFSIGTSWGTYAVVFPLAMPLAFEVNPDPFYMKLCFAAVLGGAVFGDQCSPISDTTILSSVACGADMMDHVTTQIPLALTAAGLAAVLYTILASFA